MLSQKQQKMHTATHWIGCKNNDSNSGSVLFKTLTQVSVHPCLVCTLIVILLLCKRSPSLNKQTLVYLKTIHLVHLQVNIGAIHNSMNAEKAFNEFRNQKNVPFLLGNNNIPYHKFIGAWGIKKDKQIFFFLFFCFKPGWSLNQESSLLRKLKTKKILWPCLSFTTLYSSGAASPRKTFYATLKKKTISSASYG